MDSGYFSRHGVGRALLVSASNRLASKGLLAHLPGCDGLAPCDLGLVRPEVEWDLEQAAAREPEGLQEGGANVSQHATARHSMTRTNMT